PGRSAARAGLDRRVRAGRPGYVRSEECCLLYSPLAGWVSARWFMPSASLAEAALVDGVQVQGASCSKTYSAGCGAPPLAWLDTAGRVAGSPRPRRCTRTGGMRTTGDRQDHAGPGDGRTVA